MSDTPLPPDADILVGEAAGGGWIERPLFPLGSVLFPGGLLALKVFEARYLDLMSQCLRDRSPFGVVTLTQGGEVRQADEAVTFSDVGCLAQIDQCDSDQADILHLRCHGGQRFELRAAHQRSDGLWLAATREIAPDEPALPAPECLGSVTALGRAISALDAQGHSPILAPYRLDDAGWVANRWCELLPIPLPTRLKLMALPDAQARLMLVDGFLRRHGIVKD